MLAYYLDISAIPDSPRPSRGDACKRRTKPVIATEEPAVKVVSVHDITRLWVQDNSQITNYFPSEVRGLVVSDVIGMYHRGFNDCFVGFDVECDGEVNRGETFADSPHQNLALGGTHRSTSTTGASSIASTRKTTTYRTSAKNPLEFTKLVG